jgi:hypothetical protein
MYVRAIVLCAYLAAVAVNEIDDRLNLLLEHTIGGRIRNHKGSEVVLVLLGLCAEISDINVAVLVTREREQQEE